MPARPQMRPRSRERLSEAIAEAGLDTVRLGRRIGVSKQFVAMLIAGTRGCKHSTAEAIAKAIGLSVGELFVSQLSEYSDKKLEVDVAEEDPYLLFDEVCALTRTEPSTMRNYRTAGQGPPFFKQGRRLKCRRSKALAWMRKFEPADE